jgi:hypothetical protein
MPQSPILQSFTLPNYIALISTLSARGYRVVRLSEMDPTTRHLLLRHDVDMCLEMATTMALAERRAGLTAIYYVLVRTEMYNIASHANRSALRRLTELGHDIGLHFDPADIPDTHEDLNREAALDCELLESLIGRKVSSISFHRPPTRLQGSSESIAGRPHVYQPRYFTEIGYCSDSGGQFRFHHPLHHPAVAEGRALQLLTHPIWWVGKDAAPLQRLDAFVRRRDSFFRRELAANCRLYQ